MLQEEVPFGEMRLLVQFNGIYAALGVLVTRSFGTIRLAPSVTALFSMTATTRRQVCQCQMES